MGLSALVALAGCKQQPPPAEVIRGVKTVTLGEGDSRSRRNYPGKVQASRKAVLAFKVSGPLIEFPVKEGDRVEKGQVLAVLDPRDYKNQLADAASALAESQAALKAMRTARPEDIKLLESQLASAAAESDKADNDFKRAEPLFQKGLVTKSDLEQRKAAADVARAKQDSAKENLNKAKAGARKEDIESMEAKIRGLDAQTQKAQDAYDDTLLKAPFAGVVAATFVENFENIKAEQSILMLQDIENIDIIIHMTESDVATAKREDVKDMAAIFESLPGQRFEVEVKEFSTEADPATQTYKVTLTTGAPVGVNVFPGMTCTVVYDAPIVTKSGRPEFTIPAAAVLDIDGKPSVWTIDQADTAHRREVEILNLKAQDKIRVLGGLKLGETIAISGVHHLREGMKVRRLGRQIGVALR